MHLFRGRGAMMHFAPLNAPYVLSHFKYQAQLRNRTGLDALRFAVMRLQMEGRGRGIARVDWASLIAQRYR